MRFVDQENNINEGFSEDEILLLVNSLNINSKNSIIAFLKKAGKNSTVFNYEYTNLASCIKYQKNFMLLIKDNYESSLNSNNIFCFHYKYDYYKNKVFYFISTDNEENPTVYSYSEGYRHIGENFRDERFEKIGLVKTNMNFIEFLEYHTTLIFGLPIQKKIINLFWAILFFPIWFPFILIVLIKDKFFD